MLKRQGRKSAAHSSILSSLCFKQECHKIYTFQLYGLKGSSEGRQNKGGDTLKSFSLYLNALGWAGLAFLTRVVKHLANTFGLVCRAFFEFFQKQLLNDLNKSNLKLNKSLHVVFCALFTRSLHTCVFSSADKISCVGTVKKAQLRSMRLQHKKNWFQESSLVGAQI